MCYTCGQFLISIYAFLSKLVSESYKAAMTNDLLSAEHTLITFIDLSADQRTADAVFDEVPQVLRCNE